MDSSSLPDKSDRSDGWSGCKCTLSWSLFELLFIKLSDYVRVNDRDVTAETCGIDFV